MALPVSPQMHSIQVKNNGGRIAPLFADWSKSQSYIADFPNQGQSINMAQIRSVFINNEGTSATLVLAVVGTNIKYSILPGQVGVFPIYSHGLSKITLDSNVSTGTTAFAFADFDQSLFAYAAQQIAQAVEDVSLQQAATKSPTNEHGAIQTYDPDVVKAVNDLSISLGGDNHYDKDGNLLVRNPDLTLTGGRLNTDVGAALVGGRLQVSASYTLSPKGSVPTYFPENTADNPLIVSPSGTSFQDARMQFQDGQLKCVVGEITLNGGNVTVKTQDKYNAAGDLLTSLNSANPDAVVTVTQKEAVEVVASGPLPVAIENTPGVNIANVPGVIINNIPSVNINNIPNVNATIPAVSVGSWAGGIKGTSTIGTAGSVVNIRAVTCAFGIDDNGTVGNNGTFLRLTDANGVSLSFAVLNKGVQMAFSTPITLSYPITISLIDSLSNSPFSTTDAVAVSIIG